jgi:tetratricopeptide (TPR) repeat protein
MTARLKVLLRIELGSAQLALGDYRKAKHVLADVAADLVDCNFPNFDQINIRVKYLYGRSLLGMRRLGEAEGVFLETLKLVPKMSSEEAIKIMRAICDLCVAKKRKDRYKEAVATIAEIMDLEEKDPVTRASVHAELGIAEYAIGLGSAERLRGALRALRKRGDDKIINAAQTCLRQQIQPKRRLRRKTRIECV